jgi:hypothetical protein
MTYPRALPLAVHVAYEQKLGEQATYSGGVKEYVNVIYVLQTGALWSGPINRARITFEAPSGGAFVGSAGAGVTADDHIVWDFSNFKPTSDVGTAYVFATPWKELQAAEAALNEPAAGPRDYLRAAQDAILLLQTSNQPYLLPNGIKDRYADKMHHWVANAAVLDSADSWKAVGDDALFTSAAVGHNGFLNCWPESAVAAYQRAADAGSDAAVQELANLQDASQYLAQSSTSGSTACGE